MRVFIWERAKLATWRHHHEAGVVIYALNLAHARHEFSKWQKENGCYNDDCAVYLVDPDDITRIEPRLAKVYVFPDAGCC